MYPTTPLSRVWALSGALSISSRPALARAALPAISELRAAELQCSAQAQRPSSGSTAEGQGQGQYQDLEVDEEDIRKRKSAAVAKWMDKKIGSDKLRLAKLLREHHCVVRGGAEEGQKLMNALLEWKASGAAEDENSAFSVP